MSSPDIESLSANTQVCIGEKNLVSTKCRLETQLFAEGGRVQKCKINKFSLKSETAGVPHVCPRK